MCCRVFLYLFRASAKGDALRKNVLRVFFKLTWLKVNPRDGGLGGLLDFIVRQVHNSANAIQYTGYISRKLVFTKENK